MRTGSYSNKGALQAKPSFRMPDVLDAAILVDHSIDSLAASPVTQGGLTSIGLYLKQNPRIQPSGLIMSAIRRYVIPNMKKAICGLARLHNGRLEYLIILFFVLASSSPLDFLAS